MSTATPSLSPADRAAHDKASFVRRRILAEFSAGDPRGSWPAEEFAAEQRRAGVPAEVVMDLAGDRFLVIVRTAQLAVAA
ncbi:hypothetical protein ACFVTY_02025 [Streptomyces sp. NPDC058067]|uniref:hypothetical protein n=1 Tax=Streptomyces sp. NPDC058067 TaxID=3346324 RepID=UPI0036E40127